MAEKFAKLFDMVEDYCADRHARSLTSSPVPLTFMCLGAFFILYGCLLTEVRGLQNWQILMNIGLPLCGPGLSEYS